jgi:hypothetical protein
VGGRDPVPAHRGDDERGLTAPPENPFWSVAATMTRNPARRSLVRILATHPVRRPRQPLQFTLLTMFDWPGCFRTDVTALAAGPFDPMALPCQRMDEGLKEIE